MRSGFFSIPTKWFDSNFSAKGIQYSDGAIDFDYCDGIINITFSTALKQDAILHWRKGFNKIEDSGNCLNYVGEKYVVISENTKAISLKFI